jgi:photosynthetic reaction center cytochrome c subunit
MSYGLRIGLVLAGLVVVLITLFTFERPPVLSVQSGFRGTGEVQVYNPRTLANVVIPANQVPPAIAPVPDVGPRAGQVYQNVTVLGDLSVGAFTRLMAAMTQWIAPEQGCQYCHVGNNMADEGIYTKQVSRRMLQMVRHINEQWTSHVEEAGVTCYTCHRGKGIPAQVWTSAGNELSVPGTGMATVATGQNIAAPAINVTSLPNDPFTAFLWRDTPIRVIGNDPLSGGNPRSIKQAEWTYALMVHMSQALGVNCTFCHNSRSFFDWEQSAPTRVNAWYGIRMVRDINNNYVESLRPNFPPHRLGPHGDTLKVSCGTCHQGAYAPLFGAPMARDYPELARVNLTAPIAVPPR